MAQYLVGPLCGIHFRVCVSLFNRGICASPILLFTLNFRSYNLIVVGRARWRKTYCLSIRMRYVEPTKSVWRTGCILCCCFLFFSLSICKLHICDWNSEMRARARHMHVLYGAFKGVTKVKIQCNEWRGKSITHFTGAVHCTWSYFRLQLTVHVIH